MSTKVCLVKAMGFPVVMYGYESWSIKKAECWRIDVYELWFWRRLLRVPWTASRSNQSILRQISTGCSLEGLMLKLKLQYFGHLMQRADSFEKTLRLGKIEGRRRRGLQRMRWLTASPTQWTWVWEDSGNWWWPRKPGVLWFMGSQRVGHDWATELNWWKVEVWTYWSCGYTFVGIHFKEDRRCWVWQDIVLLGTKTGVWFAVGTCINLLFLWE